MGNKKPEGFSCRVRHTLSSQMVSGAFFIILQGSLANYI